MRMSLSCRTGILALSALTAALACAPAARAGLDFAETPGLTWTNDKAAVSPENDLHFHGEYSNELVTASLDKLPAHDYLLLSVQLVILRSWDGVARTNGGARMGPDFFRMGLDDGTDGVGGRTLVQACFSNTPVMSGFAPEANFQSYPSPVPGERVPYMTGADFKNMFGYYFPKDGGQPPIAVHQDAVYNLKMAVPHTGAKVTVTFRGMGLQDVTDESWGVTGLKIVPVTRQQLGVPAALPPEKDGYDTFVTGGAEIRLLRQPSYGTLLHIASGPDAVAANEAFWKLVRAGDGTAAYFAAGVDPINVDAARIAKLVDAVYNDAVPADETDARIQALLKLGITAEPVIRDLRVERNETPSRLDWALMETSMMPLEDADVRRWIVAMRILEAIGTPEAKKARATLMGAPK